MSAEDEGYTVERNYSFDLGAGCVISLVVGCIVLLILTLVVIEHLEKV